ncbi:hypothetical protein Tcan_04167 [Toxocara canis]|uniref:Uncharacterized protein n=1 Tax=Toxocara canis TaxID=6265 RepID=A0A0B2VWE0_TOXCA|nr:hypothetical protein Tcan_04167 [Toxocara canis]
MSAVVSAKITKSFVADKSKPKSRGSRGGAKRRMRIAQSQNMSKRSAVPPPYLSAANAEPCLGPSMMGYRAMGLTAPIRAQKFGFFDTAVSPKSKERRNRIAHVAMGAIGCHFRSDRAHLFHEQLLMPFVEQCCVIIIGHLKERRLGASNALAADTNGGVLAEETVSQNGIDKDLLKPRYTLFSSKHLLFGRLECDMKRVEAALKPPRFNEAPIDEAGGRASFIAPPTLGPSTIVPPVIKPPTSNLQPRVAHMEAARPTEADILAVNSTTGMNEIFAKMVWKKLNMIKDPVRLARMHTCVMGILQQAITEEATGCSGPPKKS